MAAEQSGTTRAAGSPQPGPGELPPQAVLGLLNYLTLHSLDEDYAHVAAKQPAAARASRPARPGTAAVVIIALFGLLVAIAAVQTSRSSVTTAADHQQLVAQILSRKRNLAQDRATLARVRSDVASLQRQQIEATSSGNALQAELTRFGALAASVPVQGPGIQVVVNDSPGGQQVQDSDLQLLVNGLWQVGAEAIAINGQRLSELSAIRTAGQAITVNYRDLSGPYVVSAIGNPNQMPAAFLDTAGGQTWLALRSDYGLQFDINTSEGPMKLPAAPRLALHYATAHKTNAHKAKQ